MRKIHKITTGLLALSLSFSGGISTSLAFAAENTPATNQMADLSQQEYTEKLDLAFYLATLEQNNLYSTIDEAYKEALDERVAQAYELLNIKFSENHSFSSAELRAGIDELIIASAYDLPLDPLTVENQQLVEEKLALYMEKGLAIASPILSPEAKDYSAADLENFIRSIEGSYKYRDASEDEKAIYEEILEAPKFVASTASTDTALINETYETLADDVENFENLDNKENEETEEVPAVKTETLEADTANQTSTDKKSLRGEYLEAYNKLTTDQQAEVDKMREAVDSPQPYLIIDQVKSAGKYGFPVMETDWLYPLMLDANGNGMVGETADSEKKFIENESLRNAYKNISLEQRYLLNQYDTDKDGYLSEEEIKAASLDLTGENSWMEAFKVPSTNVSPTTTPTPATTTLDTNPQVVTTQTTTTEPVTATLTQPDTVSTSRVDTGVSALTGVGVLLLAAGAGLHFINKRK